MFGHGRDWSQRFLELLALGGNSITSTNETDVGDGSLGNVVEDGKVGECLLCSDNIFITGVSASFWILCLFWTFTAMAIVADDYLMPALEYIAERLKVMPPPLKLRMLPAHFLIQQFISSISTTQTIRKKR